MNINDMEYKYPKTLIEYLTDQESEGSEIITTQIVDGTMWIITPTLKDWVIVITWYQGEDTFNLVNVCGKGYKRLQQVLNKEI